MRESSSVELLDLAKEVGDRELLMEAHRWRLMDLLVSCDVSGADREIANATQVAERLRQPYYLWRCATWRASRTILQGRFADGESQATEAYAIGERVQPLEASTVLSAQLWTLLWFRGQVEMIAQMIEAFANQNETIYPEIRIALAAAYAGANRLDEARREFETVAAGDLELINVPSGERLYVLANLAQTCVSIGDASRAALLYRLLDQYAGRAIVTLGGLMCCGPVDRYLGLLAGVRRDWAVAEHHFEKSLELSRCLASPPFACWTQQNYAAMLCARDHAGDRTRAAALLAEAVRTADTLGMAKVAADARQLMGAQAITTTTGSGASPVPAADASSMSCEGEYWTFLYRGHVSRLRNRAGMSYLATLLERPHEEVPALSLTAGFASARTSRATESDAQGGSWSDDVGEMLDPRARAAYRERLEDLQGELDEAERAHDVGRAERARAERESLQQTLSHALGLGGRARRTGSPAERARVRVTRTLREIIDRLNTASPALGEHLARSIRTGSYCCYAPSEVERWMVMQSQAATRLPSRGGESA
jgi:tetratricopeptide (TPR) repeat protein